MLKGSLTQTGFTRPFKEFNEWSMWASVGRSFQSLGAIMEKALSQVPDEPSFCDRGDMKEGLLI